VHPWSTRTRTVLVVLFDGVQPLDVAGPVDVFTSAARHATGDGPPYAVRTATLGGGAVRTAGGLRLAADLDLVRAETPDILLVPGGPGVTTAADSLVPWLCRQTPVAEQVISVCTGAFLLAAAGLLDGRRATTHWEACDELAERYPEVDVDPDVIFVHDGPVSTSAGVTAGIDLALAVVEDNLGRWVAHQVARELVVPYRRPGDQPQLTVQLANRSASDAVFEVQQWAGEHLAADLSVPALAARAGMSPRHFTRTFTDEVGVSPGRYVDMVRLEAARRMLSGTNDGVTPIARRCGYGSPEIMRRAFVRELEVSPTGYRSWAAG
jgi:transcriptional regulator GlxA family with amidase domain